MSETIIQGSPTELASQLAEKIVSPMAMKIAHHSGPHDVVAFYAALITHLTLDANVALGSDVALAILAATNRAVTSSPLVDSVFKDAGGAPSVH